MSSQIERNDRAAGSGRGNRGRRGAARRAPRERGPDVGDWIWGWHAATAALANADRGPAIRIVATADRADALAQRFPDLAGVEVAETADIGRRLPPGAVHQGLAVKMRPPAEPALDAVASPAHGVIIVLDQVTDPQNVGSVFRLAAAFGARAVVMQERRAPPLAGAVAKVAAGAVELVPCVRAVNLSRVLEQLSDRGWRAVGLSGDADTPLAEAFDGAANVLVLGSEGEGLRRLVAEHCDIVAAIPMPGRIESLNVSAAAAIALYEATRARGVRGSRED